ncbi:GP4 [Praja virus]|nr:GP4 [Praja virus]
MVATLFLILACVTGILGLEVCVPCGTLELRHVHSSVNKTFESCNKVNIQVAEEKGDEEGNSGKNDLCYQQLNECHKGKGCVQCGYLFPQEFNTTFTHTGASYVRNIYLLSFANCLFAAIDNFQLGVNTTMRVGEKGVAFCYDPGEKYRKHYERVTKQKLRWWVSPFAFRWGAVLCCLLAILVAAA